MFTFEKFPINAVVQIIVALYACIFFGFHNFFRVFQVGTMFDRNDISKVDTEIVQ